jgi:hypothetical protein
MTLIIRFDDQSLACSHKINKDSTQSQHIFFSHTYFLPAHFRTLVSYYNYGIQNKQ